MSRNVTTGIGIGLLVGFFSGITGVGGGAVLVSLMVSMMGLAQHTAHGTSLAVIVSVAVVGAIGYALPFLLGIPSQFTYDPQLALSLIPSLAIASMFGVILGARIMTALPAPQLRRIFGIFLFFVSFSMLTRGVLAIGAPLDSMQDWPWLAWPGLGLIAGIFSGILGIGGAMVMVPVMTLGAGIPQHMTQGITLAVITVTTLTGAITHYRLGNVDLAATRAIAPAAVVAVMCSSLLATQIDAFWLTKIFGLAMAYFGYQFTFTKPRPRAAPSVEEDSPSTSTT